MEETIKCLENLFLGLGDKTRLRLLSLMADGPVSVGYLVEKTGESQPKVSRHLAYLRNAGLVETKRDGKWIYYAVARQETGECDAVLTTVLSQFGTDHTRPRPKRVKPQVERPIRPIADEYIPPTDESSYEQADVEWENSDERRDEIEIFLL